MKDWLMPLWIFIGGNLILLVLFLFMPGIDSAVNSTAVATANITSTFWGWGWLMSSGTVRYLLYAFFELAILVLTGWTLLKART